MTLGNDGGTGTPRATSAITTTSTTASTTGMWGNRPLLFLAAICLAIPVIALMWVGSYAKETPKLGSIPFFFWYQFLWVILTSVFTYSAHRLVLAARRQRAGRDGVAR